MLKIFSEKKQVVQLNTEYANSSIKLMYVMLCDLIVKTGSGKSRHAELVCVWGRGGVEQGIHTVVQSLSTGCSLGKYQYLHSGEIR